MRIVLLTSSLGAGGAERVAATLSNAWAARGDKVLLLPTYSGGGASFYEISNGVQLTYLTDTAGTTGNLIFNYPRRLRTLRKLVLSWSPDVIVSFLPNVNVAAILSTAFSKIPLIVCERSDPTSRPAPWLWARATKLLYRFADMLAVQTPSVAEKMPSFYPGVASIRSISNPLPEQVARDMSRTNSPRKSLLSLGRLSSEKQVHRIIEAFSRTACEFEDWDLNIYGDGPEKSALIQIVKDLGLQQRVFICGQTRSPWDIMAGSSAFVMTSQYEGFPNSLLEAMGVGLPCITFDCPSGPREISENGEAALLVPLNDQNALVSAMRLIMRDDAFRISLGHKARSSVLTRFSLGAVLAQWDELFVEVGAS